MYIYPIATTEYISLILVAGGVGSRVGAEIPKQYIGVGGKPILFHTLEALTSACEFTEIAIVMAPQWQEQWEDMAAKQGWTQSVKLVDGGETRFHSVRNGIRALTPHGGVVAVHDAVRPLVSKEVVQACVAKARETGSAIPIVEIRDSLRHISGDESRPVDRSHFAAVQTPQCFEDGLLREAYNQEYQPSFTDDATVVEKLDKEMSLVDGDHDNRKITYPEDLDWLRRWLAARDR